MGYRPPQHLLEVLQKIEFEEALAADDPRYVKTQAARGSEKTLHRLAKKFGLLLTTGQFFAPAQKHVLFFGHTGSGKTTELRRYAKDLEGPGSFFVVEVDITVELDRNNLQYADTLMAMARGLLARVNETHVQLGSGDLKELEDWFRERVLSAVETKDFAAEVKAGAGAKAGIPFLLDLFAKFTAAFKTNVTYKDSLRHVIRNSFTEFAKAFNGLLRRAEAALDAGGLGKRVLFMMDGTDKLRGEDTRRFFVHDAEQLLAIEGHVIYTAPLSLKYEGNLAGKLNADLVLPMIKLYEEASATRFPAGWEAMTNILLLRADRSLFGDDREIERLVENSGGHPRELLRLLKLCCEFGEENIDAATVNLAIRQLAWEYRRFLEPEDYALLAKIDADRFMRATTSAPASCSTTLRSSNTTTAVGGAATRLCEPWKGTSARGLQSHRRGRRTDRTWQPTSRSTSTTCASPRQPSCDPSMLTTFSGW